MLKMNLTRGNIVWLRDYSQLPSGTSIQNKRRPMLVVSNNKQNRNSPVVLAVPLTTQHKRKDLPFHVMVNEKSMALCEQITTIAKDNIHSVKGTVDMKEVDKGLQNVLFLG